MIRRLLCLVLLIGVFLPVELHAQSRLLSGPAFVVDGDTIEIHGIRIRILGVDAPESRQTCRNSDGSVWACGQQASLALAARIDRQSVACHSRDTDRFGRLLALCRLGDTDLAAWMVSEGWAVASRNHVSPYRAQDRNARSAGRGLWNSWFEMPWDWRKRMAADRPR